MSDETCEAPHDSHARNAASYYTGVKEIGGNLTPAVRLWNNGIPVKMDTYKTCNNCIYCFARSLSSGSQQKNGVKFDPRLMRRASFKSYAKDFKDSAQPMNWIPWAISRKYFIELGTMAEAFQEIDVNLRSTWNFMQMCRQFKIPLLVNSKCNLLIDGPGTEYFEQLVTHTAPIIFNVSMVTQDEKDTKKLEPHCPTIKQRFELISKLREYNIPTVLYLAPYMKGYTDKNIEEFVEMMIDAGCVSVHLRNFHITGFMLRVPLWKKYSMAMKANGSMMRNGFVDCFKPDELEEIYYKMHAHAQKIDPEFEIVGMKKEWFELQMNHGRVSMERLPKEYSNGITDFCIIPILRKIRENNTKPQLLAWETIGHKRGLIECPPRVPLSGDQHSQHFIAGMHKCAHMRARRSFGEAWMDGYDWVKASMWDGLEGNEPEGFIAGQSRIHPVKHLNGKFMRDSQNSFVYAYIPKGQEGDYVEADGCVSEAKAKKFLVPKRKGDTSDKLGPPMKQIVMGPNWRARCRK